MNKKKGAKESIIIHPTSALERTKLWKEALKDTERFDEDEKEFFLSNIKKHYRGRNKIGAKYFAKLVKAITKHYDPAGEAQRIHFVLLIEEFWRDEQIKNL